MRFLKSTLCMSVGLLMLPHAFFCVALAEEVRPETKAVVFYVNGIFSTPTDRSLAIREISAGANESVGGEKLLGVEFAISHNSTNGGLDILEYVLQDKLTDYTEFWGWVGGYWPMPAWCQELVKQVEAKFYDVAYTINKDIKKHVDEYVKNIEDGRTLVLASHSQGNLFVNLAFGVLSKEQRGSIRIVSVASPDSFVAGGGQYTTLDEDAVIVAVRAAKILLGWPEPLPANTTNKLGGRSRDMLHHAFVPTYMEIQSISRSKIVQGIVAGLKDGIFQVGPHSRR